MIERPTPLSQTPVLASIQVGTIAPLGPEGVPSGFVKRGVAGPVRVGRLNLEGDAQADLSVHGGVEKAVYAYASSRYGEWLADFPHHAARFVPGAFGENLTIDGMDETAICAGDVHAIGSARLQVCQPRQPCFKFALHFEDVRLPNAMVRSGRSGWYYRVVEEGVIAPGDSVTLVDRPNPDVDFTSLVALVYRRQASLDYLARLAEAEGVADWLKESAAQSLRRKGGH